MPINEVDLKNGGKVSFQTLLSLPFGFMDRVLNKLEYTETAGDIIVFGS